MDKKIVQKSFYRHKCTDKNLGNQETFESFHSFNIK